jgi:hypothetical protein
VFDVADDAGMASLERGLVPRLDLAIIGKPIQEFGVFGQAFFPRRRDSSFSGAMSFVGLLFLATCAGDPGEQLQSGRVLPWAGPEGRWVGSVTPADADCGLRTTGLMSVGRNTFSFDPFQSTSVLQGEVGSAGDLVGEAVHPVPGNRSSTMGFLGRIQHRDGVDRIVGMLTSGRCHWSVSLLRG